MTRNYTLDFYKLIATFAICFHHFIGYFNIQIEQNFYLFVELFFIISGLFLYKSFTVNKNDNEISYTKKRLKKLYPHYLLSFAILYLLLLFKNAITSNINIENFLFVPLSEIFMISKVGIFNKIINYPTWYLSVVIVGGYFIYYLLKNNHEKFIKFTGPLIILASYTLINSLTNGTIEIWDNVLIFCIPLLRGTSDMIIGCILGAILEQKKYLFTLKVSPYYIKLFELIMFFLLFILLTHKTNCELYVLLIFPILILLSYNKNSISNILFNKKIFQKLSVVCYPMYLNHVIIIKGFSVIFNEPINLYFVTPIYFVILILYSLLTIKILDKIIIFLKQTKTN